MDWFWLLLGWQHRVYYCVLDDSVNELWVRGIDIDDDKLTNIRSQLEDASTKHVTVIINIRS